MYHLVRQLKKHQSDIMISVILVSPVLSTNDLEEFFKMKTLRKSVWIIIIIILFCFISLLLLLLLFYFVLFYHYYYYFLL